MSLSDYQQQPLQSQRPSSRHLALSMDKTDPTAYSVMKDHVSAYSGSGQPSERRMGSKTRPGSRNAKNPPSRLSNKSNTSRTSRASMPRAVRSGTRPGSSKQYDREISEIMRQNRKTAPTPTTRPTLPRAPSRNTNQTAQSLCMFQNRFKESECGGSMHNPPSVRSSGPDTFRQHTRTSNSFKQGPIGTVDSKGTASPQPLNLGVNSMVEDTLTAWDKRMTIDREQTKWAALGNDDIPPIEPIAERDSEFERSAFPSAKGKSSLQVTSPPEAAYGGCLDGNFLKGFKQQDRTIEPSKLPTFPNTREGTQLVSDSELEDYDRASDQRVRDLINMPRQIHDASSREILLATHHSISGQLKQAQDDIQDLVRINNNFARCDTECTLGPGQVQKVLPGGVKQPKQQRLSRVKKSKAATGKNGTSRSRDASRRLRREKSQGTKTAAASRTRSRSKSGERSAKRQMSFGSSSYCKTMSTANRLNIAKKKPTKKAARPRQREIEDDLFAIIESQKTSQASLAAEQQYGDSINQEATHESVRAAVALVESQRDERLSDGDADFSFVGFLKNIQLYIQADSVGDDSRSILYRNLDFLREKYRTFVGKKEEPTVTAVEAEIVSDQYPMLQGANARAGAAASVASIHRVPNSRMLSILTAEPTTGPATEAQSVAPPRASRKDAATQKSPSTTAKKKSSSLRKRWNSSIEAPRVSRSRSISKHSKSISRERALSRSKSPGASEMTTRQQSLEKPRRSQRVSKKPDRPWRTSIGYQEDLLARQRRQSAATLSHSEFAHPSMGYGADSASIETQVEKSRKSLKSQSKGTKRSNRYCTIRNARTRSLSSNESGPHIVPRPADEKHQKQIDFIQRMYEEVVIDPQKKKRAARKSIERQKEQQARQVIEKVQNYQRKTDRSSSRQKTVGVQAHMSKQTQSRQSTKQSHRTMQSRQEKVTSRFRQLSPDAMQESSIHLYSKPPSSHPNTFNLQSHASTDPFYSQAIDGHVVSRNQFGSNADLQLSSREQLTIGHVRPAEPTSSAENFTAQTVGAQTQQAIDAAIRDIRDLKGSLQYEPDLTYEQSHPRADNGPISQYEAELDDDRQIQYVEHGHMPGVHGAPSNLVREIDHEDPEVDWRQIPPEHLDQDDPELQRLQYEHEQALAAQFMDQQLQHQHMSDFSEHRLDSGMTGSDAHQRMDETLRRQQIIEQSSQKYMNIVQQHSSLQNLHASDHGVSHDPYTRHQQRSSQDPYHHTDVSDLMRRGRDPQQLGESGFMHTTQHHSVDDAGDGTRSYFGPSGEQMKVHAGIQIEHSHPTQEENHQQYYPQLIAHASSQEVLCVPENSQQEYNGAPLQIHESAHPQTRNLNGIRDSTDPLRVTMSQDSQGDTDLVGQVQQVKAQIGDPRNLSMNEVSETLHALNKTAQELHKACRGIQNYADELKNFTKLQSQSQAEPLEAPATVGKKRLTERPSYKSSPYVHSAISSGQYVNSEAEPHQFQSYQGGAQSVKLKYAADAAASRAAANSSDLSSARKMTFVNTASSGPRKPGMVRSSSGSMNLTQSRPSSSAARDTSHRDARPTGKFPGSTRQQASGELCVGECNLTQMQLPGIEVRQSGFPSSALASYADLRRPEHLMDPHQTIPAIPEVTLESRTSQFLTKGDTLSPEEFEKLVSIHTKGMNLQGRAAGSNLAGSSAESCRTSITEREIGPKHIPSGRGEHLMKGYSELNKGRFETVNFSNPPGSLGRSDVHNTLPTQEARERNQQTLCKILTDAHGEYEIDLASDKESTTSSHLRRLYGRSLEEGSLTATEDVMSFRPRG